METLSAIYARHATEGDVGHADKGSIHSYIPAYETLLAPYRERGALLEIGLASGKSLDMWGEYFGPESVIVGVDICVAFDVRRFDERFTVIEADATKPELGMFLESRGYRTFDVIIDDGSHWQADQEAAFRLLSSRVKPGGIYVIEDILNLEMSGPALTALHPNCEVMDFRKNKGRFDDALIVFRF